MRRFVLGILALHCRGQSVRGLLSNSRSNYLQVRMLTEDGTVILDALQKSSVVELQVCMKVYVRQ
jgi:hypothetical protein